ncbi:hypothetical protein IL45_04770 [Nonlabens ulvanivorans]|uniref:Lipocalin-like domain-containing protein n=1 Tax=Nonlabens ulvanivorans TaxID=906888 RepID=A0A084JX45_NONUL|nr:lipocalin family protein [Nonlabens ulvanivorans]KEZ93529.1 hypothetical protein IL45_04770 [Nonlabens ulvanivorans]
MKHLKLISIVICVITITSCSTDDGKSEQPSNHTNLLLGVWEESNVSFDGVDSTSQTICNGERELYTFEVNGMVTEREFDDFCDERFEAGTYSLLNDTLTLSLDGDTDTYEVVELTDETLRFTFMDGNVLIEETYVKL